MDGYKIAEPEYQFDFKTGEKTREILGYRCPNCGVLNYYKNFIKTSLDKEEEKLHKQNLFRCELCKTWLRVNAYNPWDIRESNLKQEEQRGTILF